MSENTDKKSYIGADRRIGRRKDEPVEESVDYAQETIQDLNSKVEKIESIVDPNAVITIAGYSFTPAKLMVLGTLVTSLFGGLYAVFEFYKDYQGMKKAITEYVAPDLGDINKKLEVLEKEMVATRSTVTQATDYTNNIKNDLKADIRRIENIVDGIERNTKQTQREIDLSIREIQTQLRQMQKEVTTELSTSKKENELAIKQLNREIDTKIQRALDNPLAGK